MEGKQREMKGTKHKEVLSLDVLFIQCSLFACMCFKINIKATELWKMTGDTLLCEKRPFPFIERPHYKGAILGFHPK